MRVYLKIFPVMLIVFLVSCQNGRDERKDVLFREGDRHYDEICRNGKLRITVQENVILSVQDVTFLRKMEKASLLKFVSAGRSSMPDAVSYVRSGRADACVLDLTEEETGMLYLLVIRLPSGKILAVSPYAKKLFALLSSVKS